MAKRRIIVMIGSDSDLTQCLLGLLHLQSLVEQGKIEVPLIITNSIHWNTLEVLKNLEKWQHVADVMILGAGWANHLTGTGDAYLRRYLKNTNAVVVGVAFEDKKDEKHTRAAILSITEVPGSQVVFNNFVGVRGFYDACFFAATGDLRKIELPGKFKEVKERTLEESIAEARRLISEAERK
jgi:phosphoribosylcarboxyaminoimidazole (NCAIR) mutase